MVTPTRLTGGTLGMMLVTVGSLLSRAKILSFTDNDEVLNVDALYSSESVSVLFKMVWIKDDNCYVHWTFGQPVEWLEEMIVNVEVDGQLTKAQAEVVAQMIKERYSQVGSSEKPDFYELQILPNSKAVQLFVEGLAKLIRP